MWKLFLILFCLLAPAVSYAVAEDTVIAPGSSEVQSTATKKDISSNYAIIIVYLVLFSAVAILLYQYGKGGRMLRGKFNNDGIQITETKTLGNKQYLVVAEFENKRYMLGVGPGFIQKITDLEPLSEAPVADFIDSKENA